eukprot:CAMPEP_0119266660 /NCGR_PEP_ID=MMETSP1329-20130426/5072_1 /TAXON_ID=114041 /ORGANISM="Genus nov. species nov., Strain RCC1024" /LENGTH=122 /DNA_ID=CAMNT_0007266547 /DNA_START=283 /DNA_END=652 /DNA_ORIENTATION=+
MTGAPRHDERHHQGSPRKLPGVDSLLEQQFDYAEMAFAARRDQGGVSTLPIDTAAGSGVDGEQPHRERIPRLACRHERTTPRKGFQFERLPIQFVVHRAQDLLRDNIIAAHGGQIQGRVIGA